MNKFLERLPISLLYIGVFLLSVIIFYYLVYPGRELNFMGSKIGPADLSNARARQVEILSSDRIELVNDLQHPFKFTITDPGILFVSATGGAGHDGEIVKDGQARIRIFVDGSICSSDYSVVNQQSRVVHSMSASCLRHLATGEHVVRVELEQENNNGDTSLSADYFVINAAR